MNLASAKRDFLEVLVSAIDEPALASRQGMDEEKLEELARDIRLNGILQPLLLVRRGERFEVVAGHRRRLAAARAGLVSVPAIVYADHAAALERAKYAENRYREDLNPADEALFFAELLERDCAGDVDRLCEQLGESRAYVEGRLLLFSGDDKVFEALAAGKIAIGTAHALNKCTDQLQRRSFLYSAIQGGATVAVVSGWIAQWKSYAQPTDGAAAPAPGPQPLGAVPQTDFFRCCVCNGTEHVHLMQVVNVHQHCKLAILDKLLATYRGEDTLDGTGHDARR